MTKEEIKTPLVSFCEYKLDAKGNTKQTGGADLNDSVLRAAKRLAALVDWLDWEDEDGNEATLKVAVRNDTLCAEVVVGRWGEVVEHAEFAPL